MPGVQRISSKPVSNIIPDSKNLSIFRAWQPQVRGGTVSRKRNPTRANRSRPTGEANVGGTEAAAAPGRSVAQETERLRQLLLAGVLTPEEFERGKTLFAGTAVDKAASAVLLLGNLQALQEQGLLSPAEFSAKKGEILSEHFLPGSGPPPKPQAET